MTICWIFILCGIFSFTEAITALDVETGHNSADEIVSMMSAGEPALDPGLSSDPVIKLPPAPCDSNAPVRIPSQLFRVETSPEAMFPLLLDGQADGRAPPAGTLA